MNKNPQLSDTPTQYAEIWTTPVIRSVIPVEHTRGGFGDVQDQDDVHYTLIS